MGILQRIVPFLIAGIGLVLLVAALVLLSSLFLWGVIVGGILFILVSLKQYFFPSAAAHAARERVKFYYRAQDFQQRWSADERSTESTAERSGEEQANNKSGGRIIECDDFEEKK